MHSFRGHFPVLLSLAGSGPSMWLVYDVCYFIQLTLNKCLLTTAMLSEHKELLYAVTR